jgi:uncharacterized protein YdiU (UPF0061 family)
MTDNEGGKNGARSKVERVIEEYSLTGLGAELEQRWVANEEDRWSLRQLADYLNKEILQMTFKSHGRQSADEVVENAYHVLTDDNVSTAARLQLRRELDRDGIDVEKLRDDFVSHQAIHTYLRQYRGATPPSTQTKSLEMSKQAIDRLHSRMTAVVESNIDRLTETGELQITDPDVLVNVKVLCNECGSSKPVSQLYQDGGCNCSD